MKGGEIQMVDRYDSYEVGECYFCSDACTEDDFCTGCEEFVCPDCVGGAEGSYSHDVYEHEGEFFDD